MTESILRIRGIVCDLDGVVYRGPVAVPHSVAHLSASPVPIRYATNNASRPPDEVAQHLTSLGLAVNRSNVVTSSQVGAAVLRRRLGPGGLVLAIGGPGVALALAEADLRVVLPGDVPANGPVQGVLQGYGPQVTAADLGAAAYAVQSGATWIATNGDLTLPTDRGIAPGNGSLVRAVATACGREPDEVVGKPAAAMYLQCAETMSVPVQALLAVGDRLDTDIAGAVAAGMPSLLVLTGVSSLREAGLAAPDQRPTLIAADLRSLAAAYPIPRRVEQQWRCGADVGYLDPAQGWVTMTAGSPLERHTNRLYAVWSGLDDGSLRQDQVERCLHDLETDPIA